MLRAKAQFWPRVRSSGAGVDAPACPCLSSATDALCDLIHMTLPVQPSFPSVTWGHSRVWLGSGMWQMLTREPRSPDHSWLFRLGSLYVGPGVQQAECTLSPLVSCPREIHSLGEISPMHSCP